MLTQTAKITEIRSKSAGSTDTALTTAEIIPLYRADEDLPERIRASFRSVQTAKIALLVGLESGWDDRAEVLFKSFNTAVHNHLKFISVQMYVPLKQRLKQDSSGGFTRFQEFEAKASKSFVLVTAVLRTYFRSNQFFNTELLEEMKTDVERVVQEMSQQLNRERVYLFPRYLSDR